MEAKADICKEAHYKIKEAMTNKVKRENIINIMHELNDAKEVKNVGNMVIQNKNLMPIYPEIYKDQLVF